MDANFRRTHIRAREGLKNCILLKVVFGQRERKICPKKAAEKVRRNNHCIRVLQIESEIAGAPNWRRVPGFPIYATGDHRELQLRHAMATSQQLDHTS